MLPAPFPVVLDANVLFPFTLRDTLLRAAQRGLFRVHWSPEIIEEMRRNLVNTGYMAATKADKLVSTMLPVFPGATVTGYETLIDAMPNDPKDRHVAAVATKIGAQAIVTANLKDFSDSTGGHQGTIP